MSRFRSGVLHGEEVAALFDDAQARGYALPAVNIIGTNSLNATLETAASVGSPVIVQLVKRWCGVLCRKVTQAGPAGRSSARQRERSFACA